jgi:1,4-dihydroxy-2-naphthoate octaprenyltransferase
MKFVTKVSGAVSKMVVLNVLLLVVGFLELLKVSPAIPAEWVPYVLLGVGVVNLVIRIFYTSEPILK